MLTTNYLATLRPRLGVAADRNLFYITSGVAFTKASYTQGYVDAATPVGTGIATGSKSLVGWTAGAGWEYAFADHWTLRFEYLFTSFPDKVTGTGVITDAAGGSNPLQGSANLVMQTATFLAYVTDGFAWAQTKEALSGGFSGLAETFAGAASSTAVGGTVGGGLEWAMGNKWSVAGEYLYSRLGATSFAFQTAPIADGCNPGGTASCQLNVSQSSFSNNVFRLKINYKIF
jgi:opacity protein-like surface antigen